jgi:hypothetical protein
MFLKHDPAVEARAHHRLSADADLALVLAV